MPDPSQSRSGWNVERFGPERPACRHDFDAVVAERDRYLALLVEFSDHRTDSSLAWMDDWTRRVWEAADA